MIARASAFADTSFFIALVNSADDAHAKADAYARQPTFLITTEWVLSEFLTFFDPPPTRSRAAAFIRQVRANHQYLVLRADAAGFELGFSLYAARPDKEWSLVDCISFEVMRERGLDEALTADHHFEQAGYRALLRP